MALSSSGSDKANPLTPALLVQLGISLSPGQQYLIHSSHFSHVWKRQQRKIKEDRRTEVKRLTFLSSQYGLRLHQNQNLDLPQQLGSATHLISNESKSLAGVSRYQILKERRTISHIKVTTIGKRRLLGR